MPIVSACFAAKGIWRYSDCLFGVAPLVVVEKQERIAAPSRLQILSRRIAKAVAGGRDDSGSRTALQWERSSSDGSDRPFEPGDPQSRLWGSCRPDPGTVVCRPEKRSFRNFSLWEESTRVPFIIWDARKTAAEGRHSDEAVSLIDIYPTLAALAGLEKPAYVDGASLAPLLEDPTRKKTEPAITTWGRGNYAIRTRNWRYIRYFDGSEELYRHEADPQEWENLSGDPSVAEQKRKLAAWLPPREAPLVLSGKAFHGVIDADQPDVTAFRRQWNRINAEIEPPLE